MTSILLHALVVSIASAITVLAGAAFSRHWTRRLKGAKVNDVLSSYVSVIGTLYAVLLAFVLLSVWEQYDTAQSAAESEASQLSDFVRLTGGLPDQAAVQLKAAIREYTTAVVDEEWDAMASGGRSARADRALDGLWKALVSTDPAPDARGLAVYNQALERLRSASDSRQDRLSQARPSVQGVIWVLMIGGAVLTLAATFCFDASASIYLPVNAGLTLMIAFILYLIFAFDHPFSHDVGSTPDALRGVLTLLGG